LASQLAKERNRSLQLEQQIKELEAKLGLAQSNHIENKSKVNLSHELNLIEFNRDLRSLGWYS